MADSTIAPQVTRGGHVVIDTGRADRTLDDLVGIARQISAAVETVIEGKPDAIRLALTVLLAEGHVLIEDVPGARAGHRCCVRPRAALHFTPPS